jgi:hypothetical protein
MLQGHPSNEARTKKNLTRCNPGLQRVSHRTTRTSSGPGSWVSVDVDFLARLVAEPRLLISISNQAVNKSRISVRVEPWT